MVRKNATINEVQNETGAKHFEEAVNIKVLKTNAFLVKPLTAEKLLTTVADVLANGINTTKNFPGECRTEL